MPAIDIDKLTPGERLRLIEDLWQSVTLTHDLVRLAKGGSGWLSYPWPNPEHRHREEPKPGFVTKVDDGWFLGSGMYLPAD